MITTISSGNSKLPTQIDINFDEIHCNNGMNTDGKLDVAEINVNLPDGRFVRFFIGVESDKHNIKCEVATNQKHQTVKESVRGRKVTPR